jgi:hypothetical protein
MARWLGILVCAVVLIVGAASPARAFRLSVAQRMRKAKAIQASRRARARADTLHDWNQWRGALKASDRELLDSVSPDVQRLLRSALRAGRAAAE